MILKQRALAVLLSMVMVLTFMPAMTFAESDLPEMVSGTIWMDCEYGQYADFDSDPDGAVLVSITSSNTNVIEASVDEDCEYLTDNTLEPIAPGTSTITAVYTLNGSRHTTSATYTVKAFPKFATRINVDGNALDLSEPLNYHHLYNYTGTRANISYAVASGWSVTYGYYYLEYMDGSEDDYTPVGDAKLQSIGSGISFDFPLSASDLRVFFDFENRSGEKIMHSIQIHRDEDEYGPYDPGDEDDLNRGTPVSATFTFGEDAEALWGVTGTNELYDIHEPGNKFTVTYEGGDYSTIDYICVAEEDEDGGRSLGFYPFGDPSYYMSQLYPGDLKDVLAQGQNNAKIRVSFAHDEEEAAAEPEIYADIEVTGVGDGVHIHKPGGTIIENEVEPTCGQEGSYDKIVRCNDCGDLLWKVTKKIDKLPHDFGDWTYKDGEQHQRVCANDSTHVELEDHSWDEGQITQRATETAEGVKTYTCTVCGGTKTEVIAKLQPVNTEAEAAIADAETVIESGTDAEADAAIETAEQAADNAVAAAEEALETAIESGDEAKINAAQQNVADATATQKKVTAVKAKVTATRSASKASAKQAAASAQASAGTDAAVAAAQDSVNAANDAKKAADDAVTAAEESLAAAEATGNSEAISAANDALTAAKTAQTNAANAAVAAQTTLGSAVAARNAAQAAAQAAAAAAAQPAEIIDLPAVKISKPKAAKKKLTVKWKKVSKKNLKKIKGIQIQIATDPGFTNIVKTANVGKKKTSKKFSGLQKKTKYYVRIRAYGEPNHFSAWKTKSGKTK